MNFESPLIHVGYPKTATTWMQDHLWTHSGLGFACPWGGKCHEAIAWFVNQNWFTVDVEGTRTRYRAFLSDCPEYTVPVISHEDLLGTPTGGRYWPTFVASSIVEIFPKAKILITVREQESLVISLYKEYLKLGGTLALQEFTAVENDWNGILMPRCRVEWLNFHQVLDYYAGLFGREAVLVLPIEMLKTSEEAFVSKILQFVGLGGSTGMIGGVSNVALPSSKLVARRELGKVCAPLSPWLKEKIVGKGSGLVGRVIPSRVNRKLDQEWRAYVHERFSGGFRESNRELASRVSWSLERYGYLL